MSTVKVQPVESDEREVALGVVVSTPPHFLVTWGEYADQGEADGEIRVMGAVDADGEDRSEKAARIVAEAIDQAIQDGRL